MALSGYSPSVGITVNEAKTNYQLMCMCKIYCMQQSGIIGRMRCVRRLRRIDHQKETEVETEAETRTEL